MRQHKQWVSSKSSKKCCIRVFPRANVCDPECTSCISAEGSVRVSDIEKGMPCLRCNLLWQNIMRNEIMKNLCGYKLVRSQTKLNLKFIPIWESMLVHSCPSVVVMKKWRRMLCDIMQCSKAFYRRLYHSYNTMLTKIVIFVEKLRQMRITF